ncbi:bifunctional homocysteine S-methyltransferase/methylenetetrahydrofolate reductase [Paenibacillus sp. GCM10027626]|uniref:bifunctional homocysteine S-methyltransferase/methylenetetrahydrofolate reductase n=1 Tax=Paenibacillus sp. GCM10027626 TaxID=3273411 RepID=UPI0036456533
MKPLLREALGTRILTGDGAMGTYLYQMGFPIGISYEEFNVTRPNVIEDVHRRYYEAGARVIETNTFSANHESLSKYGLDQEVEAINRAGVRNARAAVGKDAYVVGAVGAIRAGKRKNMRTVNLQQMFRQQINALLEEGVDGILLETFYDLDEIRVALRVARELSDIPVLCQFAVEKDAVTQDGYTLADACDRLREDGADMIGFNCRSGPNGIMRAIEAIGQELSLPMSVYPNAGLPDYVDGKYMFTATPEYFGQSARKFADRGARIIGGCCGTTPEHVAAIAAALEGYEAKQVTIVEKQPIPRREAVELSSQHAEQKELAEPTLVDLVKQRHTVIVELDPPRDLDIRKFMAGAAALKEVRADAVTMADNSLAVTRMSNLALASLIQQQVGIRPLAHIACRDRNLIGTQSHMMGLDALGINHVLAVTGDPARFGDLPDSKSVYDLTSFEMIRMIKQLNEGVSFSGKGLKQKANFVVGAAFNPNVKYLDKAIGRLERKIETGADYIMTQPVYDPELIVKVAEGTKHLKVPIFIGIMPLASGRNAEYLHNEVPGIELSDEVRRRMSGLEGEAGRAEGVKIAEELLDVAMQHFNGIYLITPFMFYDMTVRLTKYVREKAGC